MQILLASNNRHKQREMQQILNSRLPGFLDLVTPEDLRYEPLNVVEDGLTLEENAQKKAEAYFNYTKIQCIADDTGLEIDALDGQPGVFSARFAGEQGNDAANRSKILELMKNIPSEERTAQFRTIICLKSAGVLEFSTGYCRGLISTEERGDYGFGYDSLFIPEGFEETFAEMDPELKNALSHRSMAASNLVEILLKLNF